MYQNNSLPQTQDVKVVWDGYTIFNAWVKGEINGNRAIVNLRKKTITTKLQNGTIMKEFINENVTDVNKVIFESAREFYIANVVMSD